MAHYSDQSVNDVDERSTAGAVDGLGPSWLLDAVAIVSAGVFSLAIKLALQIHAGIAPMFAGIAAGFVCLGLIATHFALRPQARPPKVSRRRVRRAAPLAPERSGESPLSLQIPDDAAQSAPAPSPSLSVPQFDERADLSVPPAPVTAEGLEHLQNLVAELARTTPGPKATTPDPDSSHQVSTAQAWAQYASARATDPGQPTAGAATLAQGHQPAPQQSAPLTGFAADLSDALSSDRLTIYLEPIQQIEADGPRYYEVSVRFKDETGAELPHRELIAAARQSGLLPRVDAAVLPRAARIAQHFRVRGRDADIFSRVHGASLPDQGFRAEVTAATIATDGPALVLSFEQSDLRGFGPVHWEILSTMQDMGLRFAVEGVTDLDMDFEALGRRGFAFVKLDSDVLLRGLPAFGGVIASADVCHHLASSGLALIVGHIDDDEALARILGFGVLFGQGALFGARRAVRSDILASPAAAA